jgi:tellurite resistance protein
MPKFEIDTDADEVLIESDREIAILRGDRRVHAARNVIAAAIAVVAD